MLVNALEMVKRAYHEGYAVPAINTQGGTYDIIRAVCKAAENLGSPIILAHYLDTGKYSGDDWFCETAKWLANRVNVPVAIHLDHAINVEDCYRMISYGVTSVMYDGSNLSLEENASNTNKVIDYAHKRDVTVEAEIGRLKRNDSKKETSITEDCLVGFEDIIKFTDMCRPDFLAVGIGNAHGFYKVSPRLNFDLLKECKEKIDMPLVLHGSTGLTEQQIKKSINCGVAKVNFGTKIRTDYIEYLKEGLKKGVDEGHAWKLSNFASDKLVESISSIICMVGSDGKY